MDSNTYDIIIIGAGIAGLYAALELVKKFPRKRICLVDKYKFIGGRLFTYKGTIEGVSYQWEEGGARISTNHALMMHLMKKYKLTPVPISGKQLYKESGAHPLEPTLFDECRAIYLEPLEGLPASVLATTTIRGLLKQFVKPADMEAFLDRYPYRAEFNTMRADLGLPVFRGEFGPEEKYVVCKEGLSELIARMRADFEKRGGTLLVQHELVEMRENTRAVFKKGAPSEGESRPDVVLEAPTMVFALPSEALKRLGPFRKWDILRHLTMRPLLRAQTGNSGSPICRRLSRRSPCVSSFPRMSGMGPCKYRIRTRRTRNLSFVFWTKRAGRRNSEKYLWRIFGNCSGIALFRIPCLSRPILGRRG